MVEKFDRGTLDDNDPKGFARRLATGVVYIGERPEDYEDVSDWAEDTLEAVSEWDEDLNVFGQKFRLFGHERAIAVSEDYSRIEVFQNSDDKYLVGNILDFLKGYSESSSHVENLESFSGLEGDELVDAVETVIDPESELNQGISQLYWTDNMDAILAERGLEVSSSNGVYEIMNGGYRLASRDGTVHVAEPERLEESNQIVYSKTGEIESLEEFHEFMYKNL